MGVLCDEAVCTTTGIGCPCAANDTRPVPENRDGFRSVTGLFYGSLGSVRNGSLYNNISSLLMGKLSPALGNLSTLKVGLERVGAHHESDVNDSVGGMFYRQQSITLPRCVVLRFLACMWMHWRALHASPLVACLSI